MEKEFVPYKIALKLKELGFEEPCFGYYDGNHNFNYMFEGKPENFSRRKFPLGHYVGWTSAPTYSQAFRFFREKHYLISSIYQLGVSLKTGLSSFEYMIDKLNNLGLSQFIEDFPYNTYEEAEIACLENLIELVESKSE